MPSSRRSTSPKAASSISAEKADISAPARTRLSIERLLSRSGLIAGGALVLAAALAWRWLLTSTMGPMDHHAMAMPVEPWSAGYLFSAWIMWAVMMVAMMLPSAAPMILLHARIDRAPTDRSRLAHTLLFTMTYLAIWAGFSALASLAQAALIDLDLVAAASLALGNRALAAALLVAAALYQLSRAKAACLDQCRSPIHFIMTYWSPGTAGTLRLGLVHGAYCVGCCWALMLLLFAAGVMNLAWVAAIAAIVFLEKVAPARWRVSKVIAGLLVAGAVALLVIR